MTYGISNDPMTPSGHSEVSTVRRDFSAVGEVATVAEAAGAERKELTAFEWVADSVKPRERAMIGIEFDGQGLVVVGGQKGRSGGFALDHALVTRFDEAPDSVVLAGRLRTFVRRQKPDVHLVLSTQRAVVRHFMLPGVPPRQRETAALWEGQKLIPFSIKDGAALYGLDFAPVTDKGWKTTLVAVPLEDAAPILDAISALDWNLASVSLIGTQRFKDNTPVGSDDSTALVSWSDRRGCFAVYHRKQLVFHYDLGPMPKPPKGLEGGMTSESAPLWQRWVDSMGVTVSDALDFHLNVNPSIPPSSLTLYGLPVEVAPLLTEWNSRFQSGVAIGDPLQDCRAGLPDGVVGWLSSRPGVIAPAMAAMLGTVSVDLTPHSVRRQKALFNRERVARSACVLSVAICAAWSGLIWSHIAGHRGESDRAREEMAQLQASPVSVKLDQAIAAATGNQLLVSTITSPSIDWMPWLKTVLATLPENAHLLSIGVEYRADKSAVIAQLEGTLSPVSVAHAMTYRDWFDRLRTLSAVAPLLANERSLDVNGSRHSAFTVELVAPASLAMSAGGTP